MPIVESDLKWKLSTTAASAGNTTAGTPGGSLGGYVSTTELASGALHALFDAVGGTENAAGRVEYRCVFVHNAHPTNTLYGARVWLEAEVAGGAVAAISVDSSPAVPVGLSSVQAKSVAGETTAPSAQTFTAPTLGSAGLDLGDLPAGHVRAVWVRRTAVNSGPLDGDGVTLRVEGDTGE